MRHSTELSCLEKTHQKAALWAERGLFLLFGLCDTAEFCRAKLAKNRLMLHSDKGKSELGVGAFGHGRLQRANTGSAFASADDLFRRHRDRGHYIIDRPRGMKGYILNLTIDGEGLVRDGAQSFTCQKGDLLLFAPAVPHYYHISPAASRWYHQWIYFFPRSHWLPALSWHCKVDQVEHYSLPEENFSEFSGMFWEIIRRNHSQGATSQLLSLTYLEMLLFRRQEIARQEEDLLLPASAVSDVRISLAMMFMQENMMRADLTLEEIAAHVHLSPSRFNHVFLAAVGQSPIKWLNGQKLKNAKRLLESTELSILQVAQRSGFVDPNYFSKFFRQQTGLSPLAPVPQKLERLSCSAQGKPRMGLKRKRKGRSLVSPALLVSSCELEVMLICIFCVS